MVKSVINVSNNITHFNYYDLLFAPTHVGRLLFSLPCLVKSMNEINTAHVDMYLILQHAWVLFLHHLFRLSPWFLCCCG